MIYKKKPRTKVSQRERARRRLLTFRRQPLRSAPPRASPETQPLSPPLSLNLIFANQLKTLLQLSLLSRRCRRLTRSPSARRQFATISCRRRRWKILEPTPPSVAASSLYRAAAASVHVPAAASASTPPRSTGYRQVCKGCGFSDGLEVWGCQSCLPGTLEPSPELSSRVTCRSWGPRCRLRWSPRDPLVL
ncbi:uncharacterized protein LOC125197816 [Salvia hispanica]|uniref:uncharacterized protein LOC125197816 n=1 Tax=Salvia hispanica TaxID=49212 RepID=UPI0020092FAB|nr:uncharacterized protein LOC125197816 [Salvia hispanica]